MLRRGLIERAGGAARVAVVAPAGIFAPDRLEAGLAHLRAWGLEPVMGPNLGARDRFLAGTVEQRLADLRWALQDPEIDAVWFARGGYGTAHLLDGLQGLSPSERPVFGFSDATALFVGLRGRARGVHGPVLTSLGSLADADTVEATRALVLEGRCPSLPGRWIGGPRERVRGALTGGNITVLASLCGTAHAWSARGGIAVLEDVSEAPYRLDRSLHQLLQAGAFEGVCGIALGEFLNCAPAADAGWTLEASLLERLAPLGVPIVAGLPVGHGARNRPWIVGAEAELDPEEGVRVV